MIYGHEAIRENLKKGLEKKTLHPALIFSGPSGIGKRLVADELWKSEYPCQIAGDMPNIYRVQPEGKSGIIKVEAIRGDEDDPEEDPGLRAWARMAPPEGLSKWCIIEDAHRLGEKAGNMILKLIEEPPPGARFIFITNNYDGVLPTLRSRMIRIPFKPLSEEDVKKIAENLGIKNPIWFELNQGAIEYPDEGSFKLACEQVTAWCALLKGGQVSLQGKALLPKKELPLSLAEQIRKPLNLFLQILNDGVRKQNKRPVRMTSFFDQLPEKVNLEMANRTFQVMKWISRNPNAELAIRFILQGSKP